MCNAHHVEMVEVWVCQDNPRMLPRQVQDNVQDIATHRGWRQRRTREIEYIREDGQVATRGCVFISSGRNFTAEFQRYWGVWHVPEWNLGPPQHLGT